MYTKATRFLASPFLFLFLVSGGGHANESSEAMTKTLSLPANKSANGLTLKKTIERPKGEYIVSFPGFSVPEGMVIQGFNVHYDVSLADSSSLNAETTEFNFYFVKARGNVAFLGEAGRHNNYFKADYFGENIIKVVATDQLTGSWAEITDTVCVDFASRRVVGGNAEDLTSGQKAKMNQNGIHDLRNPSPGMAFLPEDIHRGDVGSDQIVKGFFQTTEPRIIKTSTGALLQTTQARRIGSNDAPVGQGVIVSRSEDQGASWKHELLLAQDRNDFWGYTGMMEVGSTLYIYMSAGHPSHQHNNLKDRGIYYFTSSDDGRTWSEKIRHNQLSDALKFTPENIPRGVAITTNMLEVSGLSVDGITAPEGLGFLMHTYFRGYIFATLDGGINWIKVADSVAYENGKTNGLGKPIYLNNEMSWEVLDNSAEDIYVVFRRQATSGYKREYVFSKEMKSGNLGIKFTGLYNCSLANLKARRCHHGMSKITQGSDAGKLIFSYQGSGSRYHPRLAITKKPIGEQGIYKGMYKEVSLYDDLAWGYTDVVYLEDGLLHTCGMGKDAIVMFGESEPMNVTNHQIINLKPNGKGLDERYTTSLLIFSMDYYNALIRETLSTPHSSQTKCRSPG